MGPDKGKGGKFLVLPPGYDSKVPNDYFVVRSKTYGVWNFMRGYVKKGAPRETLLKTVAAAAEFFRSASQPEEKAVQETSPPVLAIPEPLE